MRVLKFTLKGKSAFFKNSVINQNFYPTYSHIHKPALLGLFGAVVGYKGNDCSGVLPEYLKKFNSLQIGIIPKEYSFTKQIHTYTNTVGYASEEQGRTLIVKEQWLKNVEWDIFLLIDSDEAETVSKEILDNNCYYYPYLGKNDHLAIIESPELLDMNEVKCENLIIDGLYVEPDNILYGLTGSKMYRELLPIGFDEETYQYRTKRIIMTDIPVTSKVMKVFSDGKVNISFF